MDRETLRLHLQSYSSSFREEQSFVDAFLKLLEHPSCYLRTHLPGHLTGSAFIVSPDHTQVLLIHHAKLNRWLQPGGHADGDENILAVALREMVEETGLEPTHQPSTFFDIDIHSIPARGDFPLHSHYDVRFLFEVDPRKQIFRNHESTDLKWIDLTALSDYTDSASIIRMKEKLLRGH